MDKSPDIDTNAVTVVEAPAPAVPPKGALLSVFRHRNYRLFFTGQTISLIGFWMQAIAQSWLVYRLTDSPLLLGLVGFASQAPVLFVSPFAGVVADRLNRRRILLITQVLMMTFATALALLTLSGANSVMSRGPDQSSRCLISSQLRPSTGSGRPEPA